LAVLALALAGSAALALGAFGAGSPGTSTATGVFQLPAPWLGLSTQASASGSGALVTKVSPGGPAEQAGLQSGDVITAINGQAVTSPAQINGVVDAQPVGAEVLLQVSRGGQLQTVGVIVAGRSSASP
jgi:S1-C subfamily serine protease